MPSTNVTCLGPGRLFCSNLMWSAAPPKLTRNLCATDIGFKVKSHSSQLLICFDRCHSKLKHHGHLRNPPMGTLFCRGAQSDSRTVTNEGFGKTRQPSFSKWDSNPSPEKSFDSVCCQSVPHLARVQHNPTVHPQ